jgi:hypothetical protein
MALTYGCVCDNGLSPNLSEYSLTLPFYICQEWGNQCVLNCGQNNACSSDCRQNHPCGARDPTRVNSSTTTTSSIATPTSSGAAATTSAGQLYNGLGGNDGGDDGSKPKPHNAASSVSQYGGIFGTVALAACVGMGSMML